MKKILYVCLIVGMMVMGGIFAYQNNQVVDVVVLGFHWQGHLVVLIMTTLVLGVILGYVAKAFASLKLRRELSKARKQISG